MAELYVWKCGQCGSVQAMTRETNRVLRQSSQTFYCVHGHQRHYPQGPTQEQKLRDQLDAERRRAERAEQRIAEKADETAHAWRSASAYKGQVTRLKGRAKAGVCPCCNRTFKQLAQHMASQHPDFTNSAEQVAGDGA